MSKFGDHDFFRNQERTDLIKAIEDPKQFCPEYRHCSFGGNIPDCAITGEYRDKFTQWFHKLIALSDAPRHGDLRKALRVMRGSEALKACTLQRVHRVAIWENSHEEIIRKAKDYEPIRAAAETRITKAKAEIRKLKSTVISSDRLRPELPSLSNLAFYKQSLLELASSTLEALEQIYQHEAKVASPDMLKVVLKGTLRQEKGELLHESSRARNERRWSELARLLEAGRAALRQADLANSRVGDKTGEALRQEAGELSAEEIEKIRLWSDLIQPGLSERVECDLKQKQITEDVIGGKPALSIFCSMMIDFSLVFLNRFVSTAPARDQATDRANREDSCSQKGSSCDPFDGWSSLSPEQIDQLAERLNPLSATR